MFIWTRPPAPGRAEGDEAQGSQLHPCRGLRRRRALKHGPISLLDAECPLVAIATRSRIYDKLISNVMEGRARDARVIAVATDGDPNIGRYSDDVLWVADTHEALSLRLPVIPLQLFAYHTAVARGHRNATSPRNLAKSVTVE